MKTSKHLTAEDFADLVARVRKGESQRAIREATDYSNVVVGPLFVYFRRWDSRPEIVEVETKKIRRWCERLGIDTPKRPRQKPHKGEADVPVKRAAKVSDAKS